MRKRKTRIVAFLMTACILSLSSCGTKEVSVSSTNDIELLEPVGKVANYEMPAYRNMYDYKVVPAFVCPDMTEYGFASGQLFKSYGKYPGQEVEKGSVLLYGETENIDKQIEAQEKKLTEMEENYQESMKELKENLVEPKKNEENYRNVLEEMQKTKPEEKIVVTDENGEQQEEISPYYQEWQAEYNKVDTIYRDNLIAMQKLEASISQKEELFNLDYAYEKKQLQNMKKSKLDCVVSSSREGIVMGMNYINYNQYVEKQVSTVAVGDMNTLELRCEFVNKATVTQAEDIYAVIHGEKYDLEYHSIDPDTYKQLTQNGGKVYSTFTLTKEAPEVKCGDYATIVIINQRKNNVLSVSAEAVHGSGSERYVYVLNGTESVYTPVKIGMKDSQYVEIVSGITEQDKIIADVAVVKGTKEETLKKGEVHYDYNATAELTYMSQKYLFNEIKYGTVYVEESNVRFLQPVSKGDTLYKVRVVQDNISLKRLENKLLRETQRINDLHHEYRNDKENKYYLKTVEKKLENIAEIEKTIKEMKSDFAVKEIKAPFDGVIVGYNEVKKDDLLKYNDYLCAIADGSNCYLQVEDKGHILNYNNEITVYYEDLEGKKKSAIGAVATVNNMALSEDLRNDRMLISLSIEDLADIVECSFGGDRGWGRWNARYSIEADLRKMDNVVLVPRKAVVENGGQTFVRVKNENGEVVLMEFVAGGSDSSNYWAAEGLTEGMTICLE